MTEIFETFKPKNSIVAQYVHYYYLDVKPKNQLTEFTCFPHYNNTISIYKACIKSGDKIVYQENTSYFQIFTPLREKILCVKQVGQVHRIVIVFKVLGIQHFFKRLSFSSYITDYEFFKPQELKKLFNTLNTEAITFFMDNFLLNRYAESNNKILTTAVNYIISNYENFSVKKLSDDLDISRRHLNRLFKTNTGVSVKKFQEIVLFRKTMESKLLISPQQNLTALAYQFNFSDQAHLIKTFKNLTQNPPKKFFSKGTLLGKEDIFWHVQ